MSDGMGREPAYLSSHATNRYFIPNWGLNCIKAKLFYPIHGVSHCTLQENAKRKIERYAKLLQEETESNTKDTVLKSNFLASALSLFLIDIIRLGDWEEADKLDVNSDPHRTYWRFVDLIEKNFAQHHSVKFYTETMRISQTTLAAHTQQYAKTSPLKLINDRIILEAKRMIRYSDLRIKEIAFDLGFKDDSYFIKLFKRNVGMSPVEFRQKRNSRPRSLGNGYEERPPEVKRALPLGPGGLIVFLIN